jgi:hypothetical protein
MVLGKMLTHWPAVAVLGAYAVASASCGGSVDGEGSGTPGWGQPEALGRGLNYAALAGDGLGNAVAVWVPSPGTGGVVPNLAVRRFAPGTGWAPIEALDSPSGMSFQNPSVAMDTAGRIVVVWSAGDGLYASRFVAAGWGTPRRISQAVRGSIASPALKLDGAGNGLAVWSQGSALWTARFESASGWSEPAPLPESHGVGAVSDAPPALALNATGDGLTLWTQGQQGAQTLWASAFTPSNGWSRQERIGPDSPLHLFGLGATLNASGNGLVLSVQQDPNVNGDDTVVAQRYQPGAGFAPAEPLGNFGWLAAGLDPEGNAIVFTIGPQALRVHRYAAGLGWQSPELLEGVGGYDAIPVDANGNGWILWENQSPDHEIWSRRLVGGRPADPLARVAQPSSGSASQVRAVADSRGGAVALWFEQTGGTMFDPEWTLVANRFLVR